MNTARGPIGRTVSLPVLGVAACLALSACGGGDGNAARPLRWIKH